MTNLRSISIEGFLPVTSEFKRGAAVSMKWLPIASLRVNDDYQRNISNGGKSNTRQIARKFSWRKFTPVIVCKEKPDSEYYVIIDGQHRTTAALLIGLTEVPCAIVTADTIEEQADSFKSINANITRVSAQDLYFADLASGDGNAKAVADLCKKAEITIVKAAINKSLEVGQCNSVASLKICLNNYGLPITLNALNAITKTGDGNKGLLRPDLIKALCKLLKANSKWVHHPQWLGAFKGIDLRYEFNKAMNTVTDYKTSKQTLIMLALQPRLAKTLGPGGA